MNEKKVQVEKFDFENFKSKSQMISSKIAIKVYSNKNNEIAIVKDLRLFDFDDIKHLDLSNFIVLEDENKCKKWFEISQIKCLNEYLFLLINNKEKQVNKERIKFIKYCDFHKNEFVKEYFNIPRNKIDKMFIDKFLTVFEDLLKRFENNE